MKFCSTAQSFSWVPAKLLERYKDIQQNYSSNICLFSYQGSVQYFCKKLGGQTWSGPHSCPAFTSFWVIILSRWIAFHQFFTVGHKNFGCVPHASAFAICYFVCPCYYTCECKAPLTAVTRSSFSECTRKIYVQTEITLVSHDENDLLSVSETRARRKVHRWPYASCQECPSEKTLSPLSEVWSSEKAKGKYYVRGSSNSHGYCMMLTYL